jgi:predicted acetyltransferase
MSDVEIVHPVHVDEARSWLANIATTFLEDPEGDNFDRYVEAFRREWGVVRSWGARAHGRWVATLATEPHMLTVPGPRGGTADLAIDGLTAVTVNATHRRRGLLTQMLTEALREAAERGDVMSALVAAEWPIYGRFGYAPASLEAKYTYYPRRSGITPAASGQVRQVDAAELGAVAPQIFERARAERAGQIDRHGEWWPRRLGLDGYRPFRSGKAPNLYLHESDDGPDGLLCWSAERDFDIDGQLGSISVSELVAASDTAYRNLWAYLGGIDVIDEVTLPHRPVDEPVRWLLPDGRALRQTYAGDSLWLRILDVPRSLAARSYATPGRLVLDVVDDTGGYATGCYLLEADDSGSSCERTSLEPDLELSQRALAGVYLGGFSLRQLRIAGHVRELRAGALDQADVMFGAVPAPWNATNF